MSSIELQGISQIYKICRKKRVLFVTTKELDYIRNAQEIRLLREYAAHCRAIGSSSRRYVLRLLKVYWELLLHPVGEYDLIWLGFAPQLLFPFFWKFRKKRMCIDFFISFYDTLCLDRKKVQPDSAAGRFLHRLDQAVLQRADYVICDTKVHGEYFAEEFHTPKKKLFPVYLQADSSVFYPRKNERPKTLNGKYVVLYFGSILPLQGVDIVLEAMELLKEKGELFFFLIGPLPRNLSAVKPESDNITYIHWLPREKLAEYIGFADLCLAGHFNAKIAKASRTIPGKAFIYKAMNRRMILGDNPANREIFSEDESTVFVEMGNAAALAGAILSQAASGNGQ